jgi:RNA polymerase sigma-70 factor (ECF subfamily)
VQTTFLKLFRSSKSYAIGEPVLPWLFVIARRTLLDEQRRLRDRREMLTIEGDVPQGQSDVPEVSELEMRDAVGRLPAPYRDAIAMTKLFGFSGSEAATLLDTTTAAIKQRVHRGYAIVRDWLEGNVPAPPAAA